MNPVFSESGAGIPFVFCGKIRTLTIWTSHNFTLKWVRRFYLSGGICLPDVAQLFEQRSEFLNCFVGIGGHEEPGHSLDQLLERTLKNAQTSRSLHTSNTAWGKLWSLPIPRDWLKKAWAPERIKGRAALATPKDNFPMVYRTYKEQKCATKLPSANN